MEQIALDTIIQLVDPGSQVAHGISVDAIKFIVSNPIDGANISSSQVELDQLQKWLLVVSSDMQTRGRALLLRDKYAAIFNSLAQKCLALCADTAKHGAILELLQDVCYTSGQLPLSYWIAESVVQINYKQRIGSGGEALVYRGTYNGQDIVAREVHPPSFQPWSSGDGKCILDFLRREIVTHAQLKHENVIPLLGVLPGSDYSPPTMILPFYKNGTALNYLNNLHDDQISAATVKIICDVTKGLSYLHMRNPPVVHGDLHPDNILINFAGNGILCDFGLSRIRHEITRSRPDIQQGGNDRYLAPELCSGQRTVRTTQASDVYSLAMTLLALSTRMHPFEEHPVARNAMSAAIRMERPKRPESLPFPSPVSDVLWKYLATMWAHEPQIRPTALRVHEFMESALVESPTPDNHQSRGITDKSIITHNLPTPTPQAQDSEEPILIEKPTPDQRGSIGITNESTSTHELPTPQAQEPVKSVLVEKPTLGQRGSTGITDKSLLMQGHSPTPDRRVSRYMMFTPDGNPTPDHRGPTDISGEGTPTHGLPSPTPQAQKSVRFNLAEEPIPHQRRHSGIADKCPPYKELAMKKRMDRDHAITAALLSIGPPEASRDLTQPQQLIPNIGEYISANAAQIVKNIETGRWTATSVLQAYIVQSAKAQDAVNCLTEILFKDALEQAQVLDAEFNETGRIRGALHGVPVSAKDLFMIEGRDASIGYTSWANAPSMDTSEIIESIREAGGIIFAKTNVPQTMISFECSNPLWGRTLHPLRSNVDSTESGRFRGRFRSKETTATPEDERPFTCGGSSGGEAALLACDGAAIGLGSDSDGGLRIPSGFCGIYAFKTSPRRTSAKGVVSPNPDFTDITVCHGPMGRSIKDIQLGLQVLLGKGDSEDTTLYRDVTAEIPEILNFGFYLSDGVVKASPACQRAVMETVKALRAQGHRCTLFAPPEVEEAMRIFVGLTSADGYDEILSHIKKDPQEDSLRLLTLGPRLPNVVREAGAWAIDNLARDETFAAALRSSKRKNPEQLEKVRKHHAEYVNKFNQEVWRKYGFDGIICPILASPALPHGASKSLGPLAISTFLYNVVPSAVGVIPVTRVDPIKDKLTAEWTGRPAPPSRKSSPKGLGAAFSSTGPLDRPVESFFPDPIAPSSLLYPPEIFPTGPHGSSILEGNLYNGRSPVYDADAMEGLPVGVQIVGRDKDDEKVLEMMRIVDEALAIASKGRRDFGPRTSSRYLGSSY